MMTAPGKKKPGPVQQQALRSLPSVEELLEAEALAADAVSHGHRLVADAARSVLARLRRDILAGVPVDAAQSSPERLAAQVRQEAARIYRPTLRPLINATGVVVHTNLGRSILAPEAIRAVEEVSVSYSNLEYNLEAGTRGSRHDHITRIITELTGAEDALVVNNNAAAVLLALSTFASGREVVVSRGELIEIGGSFRIPEIMAASAARLVEVGTTNKTKINDYRKAIGPGTAMLLHIHTSNYAVVGFTAAVEVAELARLGHERGLVVMDDLGSGALAELPVFASEPPVKSSLAAGADIVTFSGDKLLGGPQAGIVVGSADAVGRMKAHPMARALRVDKMTLAALQATLALYLKPEEAAARIPTLRMLSEPEESLRARAEALAAGLKDLEPAVTASVEKAVSKVGGGALPLLELDSYVCAVAPVSLSVDELAARLRKTDPAVIGRIHKDRLLLDARTVLPGQVEAVTAAFGQATGI
ncbi:MAG: L-seryl-tRNA(Sec) selenium transferase [Actinomycetota bacterium]|nr:L-seryl-tRNA(Sec) selenium transferase [Actinomycetota bacterium]MCL6093855.1 L-seryl-tRNA(Sec) selenium transferase [Actinomycetota bacterium]MDA8166376.1 L-seryl-tRNA(Sec) selenium transferase [Actinomycetota bacterium]